MKHAAAQPSNPAPPPAGPTPGRAHQPLTMAEIQAACDRQSIPVILSLEQAAALIHLKPSTLKRKVSEGAFQGAVSRGKPLRFWRDRLIYQVMRPA